jgi:hypothetical protein
VPNILEDLASQHATLRTALADCEQSAAGDLESALLRLKPVLEAHLTAKDAFYRQVREICASRSDSAGVTVAGIFENNMKTLSSGVRGFLDSLGTLVKNPAQLSQRFKTVAQVLRSRLDTEEQAVFPIYRRHLPGPEAGR